MLLNAVSPHQRYESAPDSTVRVLQSVSCPVSILIRLKNRHDLSWGTKGSDGAQTADLGIVHGVGKHVEVELVTAQHDIDVAYQDALDNLRIKRTRVDDDERPPKREAKELLQKDIYVSRRGPGRQALTLRPGQLQNKRKRLRGNGLKASFYCCGRCRTPCWQVQFSLLETPLRLSREVRVAQECTC